METSFTIDFLLNPRVAWWHFQICPTNDIMASSKSEPHVFTPSPSLPLAGNCAPSHVTAPFHWLKLESKLLFWMFPLDRILLHFNGIIYISPFFPRRGLEVGCKKKKSGLGKPGHRPRFLGFPVLKCWEIPTYEYVFPFCCRWRIFAYLSFSHCSNTPLHISTKSLNSTKRSSPVATLTPASKRFL